MPENTALLVVFASQVLLVSFFFPRMLLRKVRHVLETYPPSQYPKLYPVPLDVVEKAQRRYRISNLLILLLGLALVFVGFYSPSAELLGWDSQSVLTLFFFLQVTPWLIVYKDPGFTLFNSRKAHSRSTRTATLQPRRLFDFVSPGFVGLAIATYIAFILFVLAAPHLWGAGYWNILFVTLLNLIFVGGIGFTLHERKRDSYQAQEDRLRRIAYAVKLLVFSSIAATIFLAMNAGLKTVGHGLDDIAQSLYFQILVVASSSVYRVEESNFDVYKEEEIVAG